MSMFSELAFLKWPFHIFSVVGRCILELEYLAWGVRFLLIGYFRLQANESYVLEVNFQFYGRIIKKVIPSAPKKTVIIVYLDNWYLGFSDRQTHNPIKIFSSGTHHNSPMSRRL
jgi:hypothetical protein